MIAYQRIRPRLRFSLRTLFVLVTASACWIGYERSIVEQRKAALRWLDQRREVGAQLEVHVLSDEEWMANRLGPYVGAPLDHHPVPLVRRLLGDEDAGFVLVPDGCTRKEWHHLATIFPEAVLVGDRGPPDPQ